MYQWFAICQNQNPIFILSEGYDTLITHSTLNSLTLYYCDSPTSPDDPLGLFCQPPFSLAFLLVLCPYLFSCRCQHFLNYYASRRGFQIHSQKGSQSLFPGAFAPSWHGLFHQQFKLCSKQAHLLPSKLGPSVSTSVMIPEFSLLISLVYPNHLTSSHLLWHSR